MMALMTAVMSVIESRAIPLTRKEVVEISFAAQLQNIDNVFSAVSDRDFTITDQEMDTTVAKVTTREIQKIDTPFNDYFTKVDMPDAYRVDARSFIERPFFVDEVVFSDTDTRYKFLNANVKFLPGDIARSNPSLLNMFKMASYGRPDLTLSISMAGTITHAGVVLVGILPPLPIYVSNAFPSFNKRLINTLLSGPHAYLHANEATSVALKVPWYCNTDMATTDMETTSGYVPTLDITETNGNYGTIVYMVLNPLQPSTGSTKSLKIVVEACFKNFDLAVPTPRFVTWNAQMQPAVRKLSKREMYNPTYEDFDRLAKEHGITEWKRMSLPRKVRFMRTIRKYLPFISGALSLSAIFVRVLFMIISGDDPMILTDEVDMDPTPVLLPIDKVMRVASTVQEMTPQSGILKEVYSGVSGAATGLLDSAAAGVKTVFGDAIDTGRKWIRDYTGLHNPNVPNIQERVINTQTNFVNNVDAPQFFEKLDPYADFNRIVKEPIFGSDVDEMAISHIVAKKQFIGSFKLNINDGTGKMLWSRPISPFQGGIGNQDGGVVCANNLELLHSFSRGWRGGLKLTLQSVMNNKQQCKLRVIKMYNPSAKAVGAYPAYSSIVNAPTHLLEFTQGGQEHVIDLPYLCRNDITPCGANMDFEALFHGIYYVYVAQPLVVSDSSPIEVEFNVFISGDKNLTFYGYTTAATYTSAYGVFPLPSSAFREGSARMISSPRTQIIQPIQFFKTAHNKDLFTQMAFSKIFSVKNSKDQWDQQTLDQYKAFYDLTDTQVRWQLANEKYVKLQEILGTKFQSTIDSWQYNAIGLCTKADIGGLSEDVRSKIVLLLGNANFQAQASIRVMNEPQKQQNVTRMDDQSLNLGHMNRLMPTLDIRPFIRRMYKTQTFSFQQAPDTYSTTALPLAGFIGEDPSFASYSPIETFSRMYYGKTTGFKFRIAVSLDKIMDDTVKDVSQLPLRVYYLPQNLNSFTPTRTILGAAPSPIAIPSGLVTSKGVPLPFQIVEKESNGSRAVYEFSIPDTSFYKFMGGPNKFYPLTSGAILPTLSQSDFGNLLISIENISSQYTAVASLEFFVGLTDESRFGYHVMAPPFLVSKEESLYLGTNDNSTTPPLSALNPFIYRGGFL